MRKFPFWTKEEDEIIKEKLGKVVTKELLQLLPGRTSGALWTRASRIKLFTGRFTHWRDGKDKYLEELVKSGKSYAQISLIIGMSRNACIGKAHRMGIHVGPRLAPKEVMRAIAKARWEKMGPIMWAARKAKRRAAPRPVESRPAATSYVEPSPSHEPVHLVQIKNGQCKFIEGNDHMMCGRKSIEGTSWCPHHYARTHIIVRRSAAMARKYEQSLEDRAGAKHSKSELQEMDGGGSVSLGLAESEAGIW